MKGMNKRFHELVNKKLLNTISKEEEVELQNIEDYYDFMDIEKTNKLKQEIKQYKRY